MFVCLPVTKLCLDKLGINEWAASLPNEPPVIRPLPIGRACHQSIFDGVGMNIAAQMDQMARRLEGPGSESSFEECSTVSVFQVVGFRVAVEDRLWNLPGWLFPILAQQQVVMVWHQAVRNYRNKILQTILPQLLDHKQIICRFMEKCGFVNPP